MVFKFHTAFALGLIALVAGTYLLMRIDKEDVCCKVFAKIVGYVVVILSILGMICSTYYSAMYWKAGHYCPSMMHGGKYGMHKMLHRGERRHMMKKSPPMKKMFERCPCMKQFVEEEKMED